MVMVAAAWATALMGAMMMYMLVTYTPGQIYHAVANGRVFDFSACGMVFYGGLIGAFPGMFIGAKLVKAETGEYLPALVPCVPLGHAFGRIGCFLGGCCYGRPTDRWYGIAFAHPASDAPVGVPLVPVQLIESLLLILLFIFMCLLAKKRRKAEIILGAYFLLYGLIRFFLEYLRFDGIRGRFGALSTSQWISLPLAALGILLIFSAKRGFFRSGGSDLP